MYEYAFNSGDCLFFASIEAAFSSAMPYTFDARPESYTRFEDIFVAEADNIVIIVDPIDSEFDALFFHSALLSVAYVLGKLDDRDAAIVFEDSKETQARITNLLRAGALVLYERGNSDAIMDSSNFELDEDTHRCHYTGSITSEINDLIIAAQIRSSIERHLNPTLLHLLEQLGDETDISKFERALPVEILEIASFGKLPPAIRNSVRLSYPVRSTQTTSYNIGSALNYCISKDQLDNDIKIDLLINDIAEIWKHVSAANKENSPGKDAQKEAVEIIEWLGFDGACWALPLLSYGYESGIDYMVEARLAGTPIDIVLA